MGGSAKCFTLDLSLDLDPKILISGPMWNLQEEEGGGGEEGEGEKEEEGPGEHCKLLGRRVAAVNL